MNPNHKHTTPEQVEQILHLYRTTTMPLAEIGQAAGGFSQATALFHVRLHTTEQERKERNSKIKAQARIATAERKRLEPKKKYPNPNALHWTEEMESKLLDLYWHTDYLLADLAPMMGVTTHQVVATIIRLVPKEDRDRRAKIVQDNRKAARKAAEEVRTRCAAEKPGPPKRKPSPVTVRPATVEEMDRNAAISTGRQWVLKSPLPGQPLTRYMEKPDDPIGRAVALKREMEREGRQ